MGVFVIAEIGSSHGGSFDRAKALAQAAAHAGADAAKLQFWSNSTRLAMRRHIQDARVYEGRSAPRYWLEPMKKTCDDLGIEFMCTCYLPEDIPVVEPYVKRFKVASFEANDVEFLDAHMSYNKPVIVSCGMNGRGPGGRWLLAHDQASLMYCVSGYPTPDAEANISMIVEDGFQGYSDHTISILSGALAVARGATIIEKHIREVDTASDNPDYPHSLSPLSFAMYVWNIRHAETLLGDGVPKIQPSEAGNVRYKVVQ